MAESGCFKDVAVQNLSVNGTLETDDIISKISITTEIAGDLTTANVNVKKSVVMPGVVQYHVTLDLNGLHSSGAENDIVGLEGAASTIVNLPSTFSLISGSARCSIAEGSFNRFDLVLSSIDNLNEDDVVTTGTFVNLLEDINANSVSTNLSPLNHVPNVVSPSTLNYLYLTNSAGLNENGDLDAGQLIINLVGYTNNNSKDSIVPLPTSFNSNQVILLPSGTTTLNAGMNGANIIIGAAAATTINLPTPSSPGMNFYIFHGVNSVSTGDIIIDTGNNLYSFSGGLTIHDTDATTANTEILGAITPGNGNDKMTLKTADTGTWIKLCFSGSAWYHTGLIASATATAVVYENR